MNHHTHSHNDHPHHHSEHDQHSDEHSHEHGAAEVNIHTQRASYKDYMPLIVVLVLITLSAVAVSLRDLLNDAFSIELFIRYFMAGFFLVFAGFKLMDLPGFVNGYAEYDLLAIRWRGYGYVYPFLELAFGLAMLVGYHPLWILWAEFLLMIFSGVGVARKLARRERFQCACLGTFLKVPLTKVTLVENFGMAFLALVLIVMQ